MALNVNIRKRLGDFDLQVSFSAGRERLALLGASGCGKSVTLRCIAGILSPDEGHIDLDGRVFYDSASHICLPPQARHAGYLFQHFALFPHLSVRRNLEAAVPDRSRRRTLIPELLRRFQLEDVASLRPRQISGGQQQRTALARMLAADPTLILLDEPFSALDSYLQYQLELELLDVLEDFPGPVVWVSHDRGEVFRNCHSVCVLDRGHSQPVRDLETLFHDPGTEAAARLSGCKNYADAIPDGTRLRLPEWNLTLDCGRPVPADVSRMGIRAHHVHPAAPGEANAFPCRVERIIQDLFTTIVLLRPLAARPEAPPLRMELDRTLWRGPAPGGELVVALRPQDILLLQET